MTSEKEKAYNRVYNKSPAGKARFKRYRLRYPEKIKKLNDKHNKQIIRFKDKFIKLKFNPRTGICSNCGKEGITNLHHTEYDESDPLAHTIELCVKCHNEQHPKSRNKMGQFTAIQPI